MGLPALRHEAPSRAVRPRLALVEAQASGKTRNASASRSKLCHSARCHDLFRTFLVIAVLFAGLGIARVALASRAAAVSIESGRMRTKVKDARFVGDSLAIKISQLATPSRIRTIALKKMRMGPAVGITYMTIPGSKHSKASATGQRPSTISRTPGAGEKRKAKAGASVLSSVMHTAAGEAQVLLLGDVGLSSSR